MHLLCSIRIHDQIPHGNSQARVQEPVHREPSFLEEHILEGSAYGWVHCAHCEKPDKCLQVPALCPVPCTPQGMGSGLAAIFFLSAPSRGTAETWSLSGQGEPVSGTSWVDSEGGKPMTEKQNGKKKTTGKKLGCQPSLKPSISIP